MRTEGESLLLPKDQGQREEQKSERLRTFQALRKLSEREARDRNFSAVP